MSPWDVLGIGPTFDRIAIRRAYAARLKLLTPEHDPASFQRLRDAYEAALVGTAGPAPIHLTQPTPEPEPKPSLGAAPAPPPPPAPTPPMELDEEAVRIGRLLAGRDVLGAAAALQAARGGASLSLTAAMALEDRLLDLLGEDRTLGEDAVRGAATRMGWYGAGKQPARVPAMERLQRRIEADRWLTELQRRSRFWRFIVGGQRGAAARLITGSGRVWLSRVLPPDPPLGRMVAEMHYHAAWIGDRLDPERVALVERLVDRSKRRRWPLLLAGLPVALAAIATGGAAGAVAFFAVLGALARWRWLVLAVLLLSLIGAIAALLGQ